MKKIIAILVMVVIIVGVLYACEHAVKVTYKYDYDKDVINVLTGKTQVRVEKTETKLMTGEIINRTNRSTTIDCTAEMLVFGNRWTTTTIEFR